MKSGLAQVDGRAGVAPADAPVVVPSRRYPIGAEYTAGHGTHFRVWAPAVHRVAVELLGEDGSVAARHTLESEPDGYFSGRVGPEVRPGTRYRFQLEDEAFPDPASRRQPEGPHGPSEIVDPTFAWTDAAWRGRPAEELVLYELHLGTFTPEGTWGAAAEQLPELTRLGITALEIMPIAEFAGRFGWGYDGVDLFAPTRHYGSPDDVRAFVDRAHALGLMVILDVVYNHLGPDGCFLHRFSPDYFTDRYQCEWGQPLNFDGPGSRPVREFFVTNARYWIEEYHFDGLRLDATQQIFDASPTHVLAEITGAVRAAAPHRHTFVVGENEPQDPRLLRAHAAGGYGLDAVWNDDFHHSAIVAATGKTEAYYRDYRGTPQEFISAAKRGFLFQGQFCAWQRKRRGSPAWDLAPRRFVTFLQNHDQVANSLAGRRLHELTSPGVYRALTALQLLLPSIPLLFQGQEFAASSPFVYFADHHPELSAQVARGRRQFLEQFRSVAAADARDSLPSCCDEASLHRSRLDFSERERHAPVYRLHEDLLRLRREETRLRDSTLDGAVLAERAFVLRYFDPAGRDDRLLLVNLGGDLRLNPAPEPLLAPPEAGGWRTLWSSENPAYGGGGTPPLETQRNWILPGPGAYFLSPDAQRELPAAKLSEKD